MPFRPFGIFAQKDFYIIWVSKLLIFSVHDEGYSGNALCTLDYISKFLLHCYLAFNVTFFQIYQDKHHIGDKLHIFFCDRYLIVLKLNVWGVMVFNTTFNNISVISWRSVLLLEETGCLEKTTDSPQVTGKFITWCCIEYISHERDSNNVIGSDSICSCTFNYHTITRPYVCVEEK